MINIKTAAQELNNMLTDAVASKGVFVALKKNLLQYKTYLVRKEQDDSWTVIYVSPKGNKYVLANTFLKISAFAVVKLHEKQRAREISEVIGNFEPRAQVSKVVAIASPDENRYDIRLEFFIINNSNPITINFFLERIR
jgi:hypothetical protein